MTVDAVPGCVPLPKQRSQALPHLKPAAATSTASPPPHTHTHLLVALVEELILQVTRQVLQAAMVFSLQAYDEWQ